MKFKKYKKMDKIKKMKILKIMTFLVKYQDTNFIINYAKYIHKT